MAVLIYVQFTQLGIVRGCGETAAVVGLASAATRRSSFPAVAVALIPS